MTHSYSSGRDYHAIYLKGIETSFSNGKRLVIQTPSGYKIKRQDGNLVTQEQFKEVKSSLKEFQKVHWDIQDILQKANLTISHTSGKFPYMRNWVGGLYNKKEKTISIGIKHPLSDFSSYFTTFKAFTHELAHMIDDLSGELNNNYALNCGESYNKQLMEMAQSKMKLLSNKTPFNKKATTEIWKTEVLASRYSIWKYWNCGSEIFARLVEQYTALMLWDNSKYAQDNFFYYSERTGYWDASDFLELVPLIRKEMNRKLHNIRNPEMKIPAIASSIL